MNPRDIRRSAMVAFMENVVKRELEDDEGPYYAFALDCNMTYRRILPNFLTEECYDEIIEDYKDDLESEDEIYYMFGDWENLYDEPERYYPEGFVKDFFCTTEEELDQFASTEEQEELLEIIREAVIEFEKSAIYKDIPKKEEFRIVCKDHDQDHEEAIEDMSATRERYCQ